MKEQAFKVVLLPISEHVTTEGLLKKFQLVAGGVGLRVLSAQLVKENEITNIQDQKRSIN